MKKVMKSLVLVVFAVVFCLPLFGCASMQHDAKINYGSAFTCYYNSASNNTRVCWNPTIKNNSIYDIDEEYIYINIYMSNGSTYTNERITFKFNINSGSTKRYNLDFYIPGKVSRVEFAYWNAHFSTFGKTYAGWILGTLICIVILMLLTAVCYFFGWNINLKIDKIKKILIGVFSVNLLAILLSLNSCWVGFFIVLLGLMLGVTLISIEYRVLEKYCKAK